MQREFPFKGLTKPDKGSANLPQDAEGNTYLHELCMNDAPPELLREAVLELGANMQAVTRSGLSPLGVAIRYGTPETVRCLLDLGAQTYFPARPDQFFSAVAEAVFWGKSAMLDLLIEYGAGIDINQPSIRGASCLFIAIDQRLPRLIEPLVAAGAFLNRETMKGGLTPLQFASREMLTSSIDALLALGPVVDQRNTVTGFTALHYAAAQGDYQTVEKLLKAGADARALTPDGRTTLMLAAERYSSTIISLLLQAGADVNARVPGEGATALHLAARAGREQVAELLLKAGADPLLTDSFNMTAARRARTKGWTETASLLERAERKAEHDFIEKAYNRLKHG